MSVCSASPHELSAASYPRLHMRQEMGQCDSHPIAPQRPSAQRFFTLRAHPPPLPQRLEPSLVVVAQALMPLQKLEERRIILSPLAQRARTNPVPLRPVAPVEKQRQVASAWAPLDPADPPSRSQIIRSCGSQPNTLPSGSRRICALLPKTHVILPMHEASERPSSLRLGKWRAACCATQPALPSSRIAPVPQPSRGLSPRSRLDYLLPHQFPASFLTSSLPSLLSGVSIRAPSLVLVCRRGREGLRQGLWHGRWQGRRPRSSRVFAWR